MSLASIVGRILLKTSVALAVTCIKYVDVVCSTSKISRFEVCCQKTETPDTAGEMGSQASQVLMMPGFTICLHLDHYRSGLSTNLSESPLEAPGTPRPQFGHRRAQVRVLPHTRLCSGSATGSRPTSLSRPTSSQGSFPAAEPPAGVRRRRGAGDPRRPGRS
jgi:hypothetical protein